MAARAAGVRCVAQGYCGSVLRFLELFGKELKLAHACREPNCG